MLELRGETLLREGGEAERREESYGMFLCVKQQNLPLSPFLSVEVCSVDSNSVCSSPPASSSCRTESLCLMMNSLLLPESQHSVPCFSKFNLSMTTLTRERCVMFVYAAFVQ